MLFNLLFIYVRGVVYVCFCISICSFSCVCALAWIRVRVRVWVQMSVYSHPLFWLWLICLPRSMKSIRILNWIIVILCWSHVKLNFYALFLLVFTMKFNKWSMRNDGSECECGSAWSNNLKWGQIVGEKQL